MSTNLFWRLAVPKKGSDLSKATKFSLSPKLWGTDGSYEAGEAILTSADVPFLQGMLAAGSEEIQRDCRELIEALEKHGEIVLWLEG